jgi:hypothetical protein
METTNSHFPVIWSPSTTVHWPHDLRVVSSGLVSSPSAAVVECDKQCLGHSSNRGTGYELGMVALVERMTSSFQRKRIENGDAVF